MLPNVVNLPSFSLLDERLCMKLLDTESLRVNGRGLPIVGK
jgi:hypothetical protein